MPHRLNREEYNNAVRDLLALDVDSAEFLPPDDEVKHFDNIATGLQVSPSFIEQYVIAARAVAVRAVGRPDARTGSQTYAAGPGNQQTHVTGLPLGTRGGMVVTHLFPSDGEYQVNIADMFTHIWGNDSEFENTVVVTLDGKHGLRDDARRRRGHEGLRPDSERRDGEGQRPPEEHSLHDHGRPAQSRRDVPPPHVRRIRRPAAAVRAGRRPRPRVPRQLVRDQRAVQADGAQHDAEPRAHLLVQPAARRRRAAVRREES